ncbi:PGPGW domain-containing protein [Thalassoroseus pseudoceratinae]|uniref:PGPGW domain-containing protein n=1 Tax=Thalassoroseus pseudoceratinae TaxID=2713176 RepID=UPI00141E5E7C|nr:PGPGW domain-containing protein [Thalassoroseus pseudoceratinae]
MLNILLQIGGLLVLIAGLATLPLPLPIGLVLIVVGLSLLATSSQRVRNMIRSWRKRNTRFNETMRNSEQNSPNWIKSAIHETDPDGEFNESES